MRIGPTKILGCPRCDAPAGLSTLLSGSTQGATLWSDGRFDAPMLPAPPEITRCAACGAFYWIADARVKGELSTWRRRERPVADVVLERPGPRIAKVITLLRAAGWRGGDDNLADVLSRPPLKVDYGLDPERAAAMVEEFRAAGAEASVLVHPVEPVSDEVLRWEKAPQIRYLEQAEHFEALALGMAATPARERYLRLWAWWIGNDPQRRGEPARPRTEQEIDSLEALSRLLDEQNPNERMMKAEIARELGRFRVALALLAPPLPEELEPIGETLRELSLRRCDAVWRIDPLEHRTG